MSDEYTPSMEVVRQVYALHPRINMLGAHRDEVAAEYDRAIDAHDAEVILEYVKRAKPEPTHIDNIDGVKAGDWFRARDAEVRQAVLVEVAEWLEERRDAFTSRSKKFKADFEGACLSDDEIAATYDAIANQVRTLSPKENITE